MFHVSTMLPFTPSNKQQLLRKRHIGNDIVTIIFQEPGSKPFTPKSVRSQFQHIFIIIRAHHPNTPHVKYSISVSRAKDVPPFGPPIPDSVLFNKCPEFAEFLLTKAINAENAVHRSTKFAAMATRTRQEYLKDLAHNFSSNTPLDSGSKLSKFSLGSGRRKDKPKPRTFPDIFSHGAVVWNVLVEDFGQSTQVDCYLGVSAERLVVVDCTNKQVIFTIHCQAVIGWTPHNNSLQLFYHRGECLMLHTYSSEVDEVKEIVDRLSVVSYGCETVEKTLQKDSKGQLGFHVYFEGVISNVEPQSLAWAAGLRAGSRLVEICKDATATLTHDQMLNLLRNASTVKLVYIPPQEDGTARRGLVEEFRPNYSALFSPAPRSLSQREMSSPEDLLQLSTSGSGHSKGILSGTRRDLHTSLFDTSPQGTLQSQGSQSQISHVTQASHDSSGSRSSGPGSDRLGSRPDVRFSENSMQFREDGQKQLQELEASTATQQSWKVLPAYNRDYVNAHNLSPKAEVSLWLERPLNADHSDRHGGSGYHSNNSSTSRTPRNTYSKTTNVGSSFSYRSKREVSNQSGSVTEQSSQAHPTETGTGLLGPPSMTNLSQGSDFSSHSSGSHGKAILTGSTQAAKPRFEGSLSRVKASPRGSGTISPTARSHQAYLANRHSFLDASPHGSNNSSPRNSRHLAAVSSEENLARLRPGARAGTTKSSPSGSTFQEDLMRLIDPNLSFTKSENSPDKEVGPRSSRLQRAQSDESICGAVTPRPTRHITIDSLGDVIFSTAKPARAMLSQHGQSPDMLSQEQKLSPRATSDLPPSLFRGSPGSSLKKRTLPLPDSCKGLDWNNLVDAANAFESKDRNKSASMGTGINADASSSSTVPKSSTRGHQVTLRSSKSTDLQKSYQHTDNSFSTGSSSRNQQDQTIHQNRERDSSTPPARPPAPSSSLVQNSVPLLNKTVSEGNGPVDSLQRIQELEARVFELEQSLNMEREARAASDAEAEALREDNARLHQESQTAAAQLRKFTEWFFNNIDRQ